MEDWNAIKTLIENLEKDATKAEAGNKAACRRVRKGMQQLKALAQSLRGKCLEIMHRVDEGA